MIYDLRFSSEGGSASGGKNLPPKTYHLKPNGGYALMLSIVVSSVVLSIGLSLLSIVQKELILSGTGRDSQFAFYAADAGLECVLYWDIHEQAFPSSGVDWSNDFPPSSLGDDCGNTDFENPDESRWNATFNDKGTPYACVSGCGGGEGETPVYGGHEDDTITLTFQIDFSPDNAPHGSCANIIITKTGNGRTGGNYEVLTKVESKGHNDACEPDGVFDNPALVERGISVSYGGD